MKVGPPERREHRAPASPELRRRGIRRRRHSTASPRPQSPRPLDLDPTTQNRRYRFQPGILAKEPLPFLKTNPQSISSLKVIAVRSYFIRLGP
jgi:hypothetical protein